MATQKVNQNLRQYLASSTDINAIVGGSTSITNARVFYSHVPEETRRQPYIWIQRRSEERLQCLDGTYTGLTETTFDLECVHYGGVADSQDLADKVKARLYNCTPGTTMGSDRIESCTVEDHADSFDRASARDDGAHVALLDVSVWHTT